MQPIVSPYNTFRFVSYAFNHANGEAEFVYAIDDALTFTERVIFPLPEKIVVDDAALDRALFALHLIAGISYYKAYCPPNIVIESGSLTKDEAAFWDKLYTHGLGEFFYRNDLDFRNYIHFPSGNEPQDLSLSSCPLPLHGAIVPLGGGKDSLVAVEMLRQAGIAFDLVALRGHDRIKKVAAAIGQPLAVIDREIDPQLFEENKKGAWNGHVPITAYVAFAMACYAVLHGKQDVIFANERSANAGNVMAGDIEINHQYSKSLEVERDIQHYIATSITLSVRYFSLLRPLSELAITKRFVENGKYFDVFSSCNRNFSLSTFDSRLLTTPWCGTCPKCAFVFGMLAAFLSKAEVVGIFGKNLYDDASLLPTYKELLALEGIKPFECVGEPDEVFAAFVLAHRRGDFAGSAVMDWFAADVLPARQDADAVIALALAPTTEHAMPDDYKNLPYAS